MKHSSRQQSGNVLFYIFIAIVLFAALSYAVSQSGRGTVQSITDERTRLAAAEIVDYSDAISKAIAAIRLRGTTLSELRFSHVDLSAADYGAPNSANAENEVFNAEGGAIIYRQAPKEALTTSAEDFAFLSSNAVQDIGTTCGTALCADLLMAVKNMNETSCRSINRMNDIGGTDGTPPTNTAFNFTARFSGATDIPTMIGNTAGSAALAGKSYGCFQNDADDLYYFYRVLWAQ